MCLSLIVFTQLFSEVARSESVVVVCLAELKQVVFANINSEAINISTTALTQLEQLHISHQTESALSECIV